MSAAQAFIKRNNLPEAYLQSAQQWFEPLLQQFAEGCQPHSRPQLIGINGSQGSGKSTLADYLCTIISERHSINCINLSMDDFYLTRTERQKLGQTVHPLLATRGVPGTHDIGLMMATLKSLLAGEPTVIPRFDKSIDDRARGSAVEKVTEPVGLIVIEGWCLGALPSPDSALANPVNELEKTEDSQGTWRNYVNLALAGDYQKMHGLIDQLIMLQAPSFDTVFSWRLEQEQKMVARLEQSARESDQQPSANKVMDEQQIRRFIQHFQRITEQTLAEMPQRAQHLFQLTENREISTYTQLSTSN
jgi:D-glycerate 3-kinase